MNEIVLNKREVDEKLKQVKREHDNFGGISSCMLTLRLAAESSGLLCSIARMSRGWLS